MKLGFNIMVGGTFSALKLWGHVCKGRLTHLNKQH